MKQRVAAPPSYSAENSDHDLLATEDQAGIHWSAFSITGRSSIGQIVEQAAFFSSYPFMSSESLTARY